MSDRPEMLFSAPEAERQVLAVILADNRAIERVRLTPADFSEPEHAKLFEIAVTIFRGGSLVTKSALAKAWPEAKDAIREIALVLPLLAELDAHIRAVQDMAGRRRIQAMADALHAAAEDLTRPAAEIAAEASGSLAKLCAAGTAKSKIQVVERISKALSMPIRITSTGIKSIDGAIGGGLMAGMMYGIAARKKVGKTVLLGSISHNVNRGGCRHLFVTGEMSPEQIEQRNIAREGRFNSIKFLTRDLPDLGAKMASYVERLPDNTIFEHAPGMTHDELRAMASQGVIAGIEGLIVDYWQLVGGKGKNESEEYHLRQVAQWLADFARKNRVWVLVAAQVNQDGNTRGGEGLKLACDMYLTLHREKDKAGAWLEMEESRFTVYGNVGSEDDPGIWLDKHGPHFTDEWRGA